MSGSELLARFRRTERVVTSVVGLLVSAVLGGLFVAGVLPVSTELVGMAAVLAVVSVYGLRGLVLP